MRKQRADFKRALYEQEYDIENIQGNDFILNKNGTRLAVELKRGEPLAETMARVQLNYDVMVKMDKKVEEYRMHTRVLR